MVSRVDQAIFLAFRPFNRYMDSEAACPLLYMTIEITPGRQDLLPVYSSDKPETLSKSFCRKHSLSSATGQKLSRLISTSMRSASRFRQGRKTVQSVTRTITRSQGSSVTPSRERRSEEPRNYGEWLYQRGQKATIQQRLRTQISKEHVSGSLSKSAKITSYSVDSLMQKGDAARQRLLARRRFMQQQERKQCPFRPTLSVKSERLSRSRSSDTPAFDRLFQDAKARTCRLSIQTSEVMNRECPFRPVTLSSRKRPETYLGIVERLMRSKLKFEEAVAKAREEIDIARQPTFRPSVGRDPVLKQSGPVFERLYERRRVVEKREESSTTTLGVDAKSREIVRRYRRRQIEALFGSLDKDRDGQVQLASLTDLPPLDSQLLRLLTPLWQFLLSASSPVTLETFSGQMETLLATASSADKAYLLRHMGEGQQSIDKTSASRETGVSQRRSLAGSDVYTRQMAERSLSADRLLRLREDKAAEELKKCTFRPTLTRYRRDPYLSIPL